MPYGILSSGAPDPIDPWAMPGGGLLGGGAVNPTDPREQELWGMTKNQSREGAPSRIGPSAAWASTAPTAFADRTSLAPPDDQSNAVPGPAGLWGAGQRWVTDGTRLYLVGGQTLIDNPILRPIWVSSPSEWTKKGGFTPGWADSLRARNIETRQIFDRPPPGSVGRDAGINRWTASNINGGAAEDATVNFLRALGYPVAAQVEQPDGMRVVDAVARVQRPDPRYNEEWWVESKSGRTGQSDHNRRQADYDARARDERQAVRRDGELHQNRGRVLHNFGRVARPVGVGLDVIELGSAFQADGNRIGENTKRAAAGIAGGALGGWAGAAGGAAIGTAILPGPGTLAGALVGGLGGGLLGDYAFRGIYDGPGSGDQPSLAWPVP